MLQKFFLDTMEMENSIELFTLRTYIDNINNERVKNKKDAPEEFKNVKKNVKSEALKEIVKDLEQAIFGDYDNDESLIEGEELPYLTRSGELPGPC